MDFKEEVMDGLKINGVSLFLGKIPSRKQECFYFEEGTALYPVAYIKSELLDDAKRLWGRMIGSKVKDNLPVV